MKLEDVLKMWEDGDANPCLMIEVTEQCNFRCGHCLRGPADKSVFSQDTLIKFLEKSEVKYLDSITFTGGEPLLHPEVIEDTLKTLWRYNVDLGNFYIATNGSAFNKESFLAIGELYTYCCDNETSCVEISDSPWHQEERRRLGLNNFIPDSFDILYDFYSDVIDDIFENHYPCFNEIVFVKDHRKYKHMVREGKYQKDGVRPAETAEDGLIYINSRGKMILNSCDFSFKSQEAIGLDI